MSAVWDVWAWIVLGGVVGLVVAVLVLAWLARRGGHCARHRPPARTSIRLYDPARPRPGRGPGRHR